MYEESAWGCWQAPDSVQEAQTLYATLEVNMLASEQEIRQQFRRLALRWHPDKCGCAERFQAIREAFEVLSDPQLRSQYDKTLVSQLDIEEYLRRFSELVLTVQGFNLPLHRAALHRPPPHPQQQRPQRPRRCHAQHHAHVHAASHMQGSPAAWGGLLTRA